MSDTDETEDLHDLNRGALNVMATALGVPHPDHLPKKEDVVEAIEAARAAKTAPNPAVVPEPEALLPKTYTVIGPNVVYGTRPGGEFTALFTPDQEAALIQSGNIEPKEGN